MKTGKEENRPTPDTDANILASISGCIRGQHGEPIERCYVPAGFAQTLERQRDEARGVLSNQDALRNHILRTMSADSIAHMLGEESVRALRQRDRLMAALKDIMAITDRDHAAWHDAKAAIAEVKGGR